MDVTEWEKRRVETFGRLCWEQTQGDPTHFDFEKILVKLNDELPTSMITSGALGRTYDVAATYPCFICKETFTRRDNRRTHLLASHLLEKVVA